MYFTQTAAHFFQYSGRGFYFMSSNTLIVDPMNLRGNLHPAYYYHC